MFKPLVYLKSLHGKRVLFTNSEYSDGMQQSAAFHQGIQCLIWLKQYSAT